MTQKTDYVLFNIIQRDKKNFNQFQVINDKKKIIGIITHNHEMQEFQYNQIAKSAWNVKQLQKIIIFLSTLNHELPYINYLQAKTEKNNTLSNIFNIFAKQKK